MTGEQFIEAAESATYDEFGEEEDREFRILLKKGTLATDKNSFLKEGSKYKVSEVKRDGVYYYTTATTSSIDLITPIFKDLEKQGLSDLEIVENDGKKFIVVTPESLKKSATATTLPKKTFTQQTLPGYFVQLDNMPSAEQMQKIGNKVQIFQTTDPSTGETMILAGSATNPEELLATQEILNQYGIMPGKAVQWNQGQFERFDNVQQLNEQMAFSKQDRTDSLQANTTTVSGDEAKANSADDKSLTGEKSSNESGEENAQTQPATNGGQSLSMQHEATTSEANNDQTLYHIVIAESQERIPFNDPRFSQIEQDIIEMEKDGKFTYVTGASHRASDLENQLANILGFNQYPAHIQAFEQIEVASMAVRTGRYLGEKNAEALNIEFSKLSDIKFEYNSAEIKEESKRVLDYIAAMLILEEDFILRVNAHTCSQGTDDYNQELSERRAESVRNYFTSRGIDPTRLLKRGFGESRPMVSNEQEEGRKQNRRVEFIILFPGKDQSQWTRSK
jgi:outer membrane protein OmpA-like peptidoglycan-associated protein